jgi:RimJ/RimL family protein N-acetyltransferase
MIPPLIRTGRLLLRPWRVQDFDAFAALYASEQSRLVGGPIGRRRAWRTMALLAGEWSLRGHGMWVVDPDPEGAGPGGGFGGHVGFFHPDHYPEPELGWVLTEAAEGRGLAEEAARAARAWGARHGIPRPVSNIDAENARSIALAERLGARREATRTEEGATWHVYRHPAPVSPCA